MLPAHLRHLNAKAALFAIGRNEIRGDASWIKVARTQSKLQSVNAVTRDEESASITFQVGGVRKPLASAAKIIESNNHVVLDKSGSFIENKTSNKRWPLEIRDGAFMFDVTIES